MKKTALEPPWPTWGKIRRDSIGEPSDFRHVAHVGLDYVDLNDGSPRIQLSSADEKCTRVRMPVGNVKGNTQEMTFSVNLDEPACQLLKLRKPQERLRKGLKKDPVFLSSPKDFRHLVHIEDTRSNACNFVAPKAVNDPTICKMFHVIDSNIETTESTELSTTKQSSPPNEAFWNNSDTVNSPSQRSTAIDASKHHEIGPLRELLPIELPSHQTRTVVDHDNGRKLVSEKTAQEKEPKLPVLLDEKDKRIDESLDKKHNSHSARDTESESGKYDRSKQSGTANLCDRRSGGMEQGMSNTKDEESIRLSTDSHTSMPSEDSTDLRQDTSRTLQDRKFSPDREAPSDQPQEPPMVPPRRNKRLDSNSRSKLEKTLQKENVSESKIKEKRNNAIESRSVSSPGSMDDRKSPPDTVIRSISQQERPMKAGRPKAEIAGNGEIVVMRPPRQMASTPEVRRSVSNPSPSPRTPSCEVRSAIGALDDVLNKESSRAVSSVSLSKQLSDGTDEMLNSHGCDDQLIDHPNHDLFTGNGNEKLSVKELTKKLNDSGTKLIFGVHVRGFPKPTLAKETLAEDGGNEGDHRDAESKNDDGTTEEEHTPAPSPLSKVQHIGVNMFGGCDGRSLADIIAEKKMRDAKQHQPQHLPKVPSRSKKPTLINPTQLDSRIALNSDSITTESNLSPVESPSNSDSDANRTQKSKISSEAEMNNDGIAHIRNTSSLVNAKNEQEMSRPGKRLIDRSHKPANQQRVSGTLSTSSTPTVKQRQNQTNDSIREGISKMDRMRQTQSMYIEDSSDGRVIPSSSASSSSPVEHDNSVKTLHAKQKSRERNDADVQAKKTTEGSESLAAVGTIASGKMSEKQQLKGQRAPQKTSRNDSRLADSSTVAKKKLETRKSPKSSTAAENTTSVCTSHASNLNFNSINPAVDTNKSIVSPSTTSSNHQTTSSNNSAAKSSLSISVSEDKMVENKAVPPNVKPNAQRSDVQQRPVPLPRMTIPCVPKEDISESNPKLKNAQKTVNGTREAATEEVSSESERTIEMTKTNGESRKDSAMNQSADEIHSSGISSELFVSGSPKDDWVLHF
ncbi:unnamed protein product [Anisakis simplex]|uniref:CRIB domain-containing protein n=1 Tax=Anisakis simplex TaxID=6269 RepID=A0A0M3JVE6_ANISI|nr:unnamed protein product [Anisakis simplex]